MPFFLTLLPILVINAGWHFIQGRAFAWKQEQHSQEADRALSSLTVNWELRNQMGFLGDLLSWNIIRHLREKKATEYVARGISNLTREFFPTQEFWIFHFQDPLTPSSFSLVRSPPVSQGGKFSLMAFQALLAMNESEDRGKKGSGFGRKALFSLFGKSIIPELLAVEQKGIPTRVLYQNRVWWLLWDSVSLPGKGGFGYFFLLPDTSETQERAYFLASQGPRKAVPGAISGFLRVFPGEVGDVLPPGLRKSSLFRKWIWTWRTPRRLLKVEQANFSAPPWKMRLGSREVFTRMAPNSTHLAFVLLRPPASEAAPAWLFLLNMIFGGGWTLLGVRRSLGWEFPRILLIHRFILLYLFAAALPLSLAVVGGIAYLQETRQTMFQHLKDKLAREILTIEERRQNVQSEYRTAFQAVLDSREVRACLKEGGVSHPGLIPAALAKFSGPGGDLPLRGFLFIDVQGREAAFSRGGKEGGIQAWNVRFFRNAILSTLWSKYKKALGHEPAGKSPLNEEEKALLKGYASFTSIPNIEQEIEERCGTMDHVTEGKESMYKVHNFIRLEDGSLYGVMMFCKPTDLDPRLLQEFRKDFGRQNPDQKLFSFNIDRGRLISLIPLPGIKTWMGTRIQEILQGNPVYGHGKKGVVTAIPIRGMSKTILGAWASTDEIEETLSRKKGNLALGLFLAILSIAVLGVVTWKRIGSPIEAVQSGIMAIESGELEKKVGLHRGDELGLLTSSFDEMTQGLALRKKLAALVSGKALDALAQSGSFESAIRGRRLQVAVLVSDIRSFTSLCESQPPGVMIDLLNDHFEAMSGAIDEFGGRIDRFIGDAIIAVFEAPFSCDGDGPVRAGLEMLRRLREMNLVRARQNLFSYQIGVGISRGEVIVGGVGDPGTRFDFTMLGAPVKEGMWLESLSKLVPHLPLVLNQAMVADSHRLTSGVIPLSGHEGVWVFPESISLERIGI